MTIQEKIKADLKVAMKEKDDERKETIRVIMGEFGRIETKEISDEQAIKVLKKLVKSEKDTIELKGEKQDSRYIQIIESYLPVVASVEEIKAWIKENIDLSEFKNKMQAMRPIMQHFGSAVDGNLVKQILQDM